MAQETKRKGKCILLEKVLETENLAKALACVVRNDGAAGIDGMGVDHLQAHYDASA